MKGLIARRRRARAVCPSCKSPDYVYTGKAHGDFGKMGFKCRSCGDTWQHGHKGGVFYELRGDRKWISPLCAKR